MIAKEIIEKYGKVSHREAFIIAQGEYHLDNQRAMWVADDVHKLLNPIPITKMKDWKEEIWEREDFQELKRLIKTFDEVSAYYGKTNHQLILIHIKINGEKSYNDVINMIHLFEDYKYKIWDTETTPIKIKHLNTIKKYFPNAEREQDKLFILANGNSQELISTYNIKEIEPCNIQ